MSSSMVVFPLMAVTHCGHPTMPDEQVRPKKPWKHVHVMNFSTCVASVGAVEVMFTSE
jgi:hypothetical protein